MTEPFRINFVCESLSNLISLGSEVVGRQLVDAPSRWDFQEVNKLLLILALSWLPFRGEHRSREKEIAAFLFWGERQV